jgi:flagellar biosynthesis/type III secretory pathway M-ring protein FliF/YscJ
MNPTKLKQLGDGIFTTIAKHPIPALIVAAVLFYLVIFLVPAFVVGLRDRASDKKVEQTKQAAGTEKTAAEQERISASETEVERKAEDLFREEKLKPERERANESLTESRKRRQQAEENYAKSRSNRSNPDPDDLNLRRRNCADLAELYPSQRFTGCQ